MEQIINSILDTDLYKLTMQMAVVNLFPYAKVKYTFINRGGTPFPENFAGELRRQIKLMENLKLTKLEKKWLQEKCPFLSPTYIDFLAGYKFDSAEIGIIQKGGVLEISIEGYWYRTILWEVPLMALISELFFKMIGELPWGEIEREKNNNKKKQLFRLNGMHFADFGTRRRFSFDVQDEFVKHMKGGLGNDNFVGTSNVYLAYKYDLTPIGTHAHEWFMFHAAKYGYKMANHLAMENWTNVYRGDLGIALSDTFTTEVFFKSFDKKFAKLYDGVRHDSGEPLEFAQKVIDHYEKLGIDPKAKAIVFSDSLNPEKAIEIKNFCRGKIKCSFGIGTNFSNDVGVKPLNMVIKITSAKPEDEDWQPTIKLSDDIGKHTGDSHEIIVAKDVLGIEKIQKMMARIKPSSEQIDSERIDETGKCFKVVNDSGEHYYRQDENRVVHMMISSDKTLINELDNNHIESMRQNWEEEFTEISSSEFSSAQTTILNKLFK